VIYIRIDICGVSTETDLNLAKCMIGDLLFRKNIERHQGWALDKEYDNDCALDVLKQLPVDLRLYSEATHSSHLPPQSKQMIILIYL
jgi:hypothetical protein